MARKTYECRDIADLGRKLAENIGKKLRKRLDKARDNTLKQGVDIVKAEVPVAFGELRDSVHVQGNTIAVDAPHAWPVENGTVPHMPPVEPLVEWATLKGFDDPESAAWAIAKTIEQKGTKPNHYMRRSIPKINKVLRREMRKALGR